MADRAREVAEELERLATLTGEDCPCAGRPCVGCKGEAKTLREASSLLREGEWQPMESAPRMRKVLVFYVNELGNGRIVLACYYTAKSLEMDYESEDLGDYDDETGINYAPEGWYEEHEHDSPLMPLQIQPTHWQPLPSAPSQTSEE